MQNSDKYKFLIEDDGGVNESTSKILKQTRTDILAADSYTFKSKNYKRAIETLRTS